MKNFIIVSASDARVRFSRLLKRVEHQAAVVVIQKRGTPRAVLLSISEYVRLATPEPDVIRILGEESRRKGTDKLGSREIRRFIQAARLALIR